MLNYKEFMEALKQTIYSQTGWKSDCMGSLTDEGPTSDTALEIHYMNTDRDASVISIRVPELYGQIPDWGKYYIHSGFSYRDNP